MKIESVFDASFRQYGKVVEGLHLDELLTALSKTEKPADGVIYVPGDDSLENTPAKKELEDNVYGGMPIQIGFCNGTNTKLNCVEYHRDSEINIPCEDMILLLGKQTDIPPRLSSGYSNHSCFSGACRNSSGSICNNTALRTLQCKERCRLPRSCGTAQRHKHR